MIVLATTSTSQLLKCVLCKQTPAEQCQVRKIHCVHKCEYPENLFVLVFIRLTCPTDPLVKKTFPIRHRCCGNDCPSDKKDNPSPGIFLFDLMHKQHIIATRQVIDAFELANFIKNIFPVSDIGAVAHGMITRRYSRCSNALQADKIQQLEYEIKEWSFVNITGAATKTGFFSCIYASYKLQPVMPAVQSASVVTIHSPLLCAMAISMAFFL
jgi:hypothetical protein